MKEGERVIFYAHIKNLNGGYAMNKGLIRRILSVTLAVAVIFGSSAFALNKPFTAKAETYTHLIGAANVEKPSVGGALQVLEKNGQKVLCDQNGNEIQLRGMSTHGLQWYPEILNNNAFAALSNDWGCNVIRLAMYVNEGGYAIDPTVKDRVIDGIDLAIDNDMYVIVDWHVLTPGNPKASIYSGAIDFFKEISQIYHDDYHIIYEICNEPNSSEPGVSNDAAGWSEVKSYAEQVISMLRNSGNSNIVLVGSPNWSQRPDLAADNPINDNNTVYTFHFYSGTHPTSSDDTDRSNIMSNVRYAMEHGVPVFCSEWGTSAADGTGGPYLDEADPWLDFLNENNISWCNWSLSNKGETSAAFMPYVAGVSDATSLDPGNDQVWTMRELSVSGEYVRSRIKGIEYDPVDRTKEDYSITAWDFDDGTTQGFGVNGDSPVKDVSVTNSDNELQLSGLTASSDTSEGNYWANVRISADSTSDEHKVDIAGAENMTMDVYAESPTTVAIAAIPQSASNGWANPNRAVIVSPSDFTKVSDNKYKATLTITTEDSPNFKAIAQSADDTKLTNMILFVGATTDTISIDNIIFNGTRSKIVNPIINDPLGEPTLPSTFEDGTRNGWAFDAASGVNGSLTIETADGNNALSWECAYPEEKPTDGWATAARLILSNVNVTRGDNRYLAFDFYFKPTNATTGSLNIFLAFAPPALGYWAQASQCLVIPLDGLTSGGTPDSCLKLTSDGLYKYTACFDLTQIDNKVIDPDTLLRDITIVIADGDSDFAGRMYLSNVRFTTTVPTDSDDSDDDEDNDDINDNGNSNGSSDKDAKVKNPNTGSDVPFAAPMLIIVGAMASAILLRKRKEEQ
jgi:endoglucanase